VGLVSADAVAESPSLRNRRGAASERAIRDAVIELLIEVGYDQLTMDAVAARARAGKATIYRRWPDKASMVLAAVKSCAGDRGTNMPLPDTASMRGDLLALGPCHAHDLPAPVLKMLPGLLMAMRRDAELPKLMRTYLVDDMVPYYREIVRRGVSRGEVDPGFNADRLAELGVGLVLNRLLLTDEPIDRAFNRYVVDEFMLPVLESACPRRHKAPPSDTGSAPANRAASRKKGRP
jgi:AcrR family transcriptional regulator